MADPHCGNHGRHGGPTVDGLNRRGRETVEVLRRALALAVDRRAAAFAVAGDLFHNRRPEPAVIRAVQDAFDRSGLPIILVPGNHDMLDASCAGGNTAMAPLARQATVFTTPGWYNTGDPARGTASVLCVPFEGTIPMAAHLAGVLEDPGDATEERRVLLTHVGLWDADEAPPWQRAARDGMDKDELLRLMRAARIRAAFVGNYHEPLEAGSVSCRAVQVGTLCPASHGDGGTQGRGRVAFLYGDDVEYQEVPGPRFVTLMDEDLAPPGQPLAAYSSEAGYSLYVRVRRPRREGEAIDLAATSWAAVDWEEGVDEGEPGVAAHLAAGETDEEAIAAHVAAMDLPAGADRGAALELALDCWRRA